MERDSSTDPWEYLSSSIFHEGLQTISINGDLEGPTPSTISVDNATTGRARSWLGIILSTSSRPTSAAACFTRNPFKAAPVVVSQDVLERSGGRARAVVINSGCANARTGQQGLDDVWAMAKATNSLLPAPSSQDETPVMSTGVIGRTLSISQVLAAIRSRLHATLLGCIMTDAAVSPQSLTNALTYAVDRSFNSISVDGNMSTNDTILLLANGAAASNGSGNYADEIDEHRDPDAYSQFKEELTAFAVDLAKLVARDGEGATKFITYSVSNFYISFCQDRVVWRGRQLGADTRCAGSVSLTVPLDHPITVNVSLIPSDGSSALPVLVNGVPEALNEERAREILRLEDSEVCVDLGALGTEEATYWTCDFSYDYVRINGDSRS
ncbi:ArgJ-like domain-containing protein [Mucidula mucida]|nr:ArgJ-like domain-containing protein [Mucidula mucida]